MKKLSAILLAALLTLSLLEGCSATTAGPSASSAAPAATTDASASPSPSAAATATTAAGAGYTFTVAITGDIAGLDPGQAYDPNTNAVVSQIAEPLLTYDDKDQLVPLIASDIKTSDNLTYVYTIRKDVKFSDGTPLTADDVVFSLQRIADPKGGALQQWMYGSVASIEKTGDYEVTIKLTQPSNSWRYVLSTSAGYVISKAAFQKSGDFVGSGAYVLDSRTSGQEIVLKKNQNYWNGDISGAPDKIVYKIIPDETTLVTALENGEVDYTSSPPLELLDQLAAVPSLQVNNFPSYGVTFIALNADRGATGDVNVRKAIYWALDLATFQKNIIGNSGTPATLIPNSSALYGEKPDQWQAFAASLPKIEYNIDKAKEYLAKSAYPNGFKATVVVNESTRYNDIALFLQESLKPLNIKVEIKKVTSEEHDKYYFGGVLDADGKRDYDALVGSWWADFADVGGNLPIYQTGTSNVAAYTNAMVQALLTEQAGVTDVDARNAKIFDALKVTADDVPYIFVQYPNQQNVLNKKFTGLKLDTATAASSLHFWKLRLAQ